MDWAETSQFSGDGHSISHYFHTLYCSYRLKDYKPSASIYQKVLQMSGFKAEESIFVDDGPRNIEAAEMVGIHGLLVPEDADWMESLLRKIEEND
jgi:putative hydrolase of the HAD superfamily